ncbi:L-2-hydroxyglutarate oxidase [Prosthecobacter sp.]|jgi:L-2-hydroxyglutarate oxidase|uniref:L-2-hydroxyglutarate oxidase n=1 Tax=Prosthecobacter sp. TaxID=1965333 RepID=UPI0037832665
MVRTFDYAVIGGGIVGLSTAMHVGRKFVGSRILVLEKESGPAQHQTGRNSGVIHSGIYYKPGSYKAKFAKAGAESMAEFCQEHGIPHEICGKLIVATNEKELPLLENLFKRGEQNGVPVERISLERAREIEPHLSCLAAVLVKSTGIASYRKVCLEYLQQIEDRGGVVKFRTQVQRVTDRGGVQVIETNAGEYEAKFVINCAGLHSDRVARAAGLDPQAKIVPFRGEYYELVPEKCHLVKTLIYPVPNPDFPFLGVHFTKMIDGGIHAGPNAVLAFAREGYLKTDFNLRDFVEIMTFGGFWKLARKNFGEGMMEIWRSLNKAAFVRSMQQLIPEIRAEDVVPSPAGIRAQALMPDGKLVDDFLIIPARNQMHVCNAPSPAATASLEIGKEVARQVPAVVSKTVGVTA